MSDEPMVTISVKMYEELIADSNFLIHLRGMGLDNWEGYDYAVQSYNEENSEDEGRQP